MSYKHITNQTDDSADINLFSDLRNGSSQEFVNEFNFLDSLGLNQINVRINSQGGSVFEGFGIISAIKNATTKVVTINEGLAASMAGMILVAGDERKAVDFSQTMTHNPSINGAEAKTEEEKNMLKSVKESLIKIFTNNTKLSEERVNELMNETTFMSAAEALKNGIIDEVISTKRKISNSIAPEELFNLVLNNFETETKTLTMKTISNHLNLDSTSTEDTILNKIKSNETTANDLFVNEEKAHNETKEALKTAQNSLKDFTAKAAEANVENAITNGKIKKEDKEKMLKIATETPEVFNTMIDSMSATRTKLGDLTNTSETEDETKKDWTIRDFEKKDPKALKEMKLNNFENYAKLFEATYGAAPIK